MRNTTLRILMSLLLLVTVSVPVARPDATRDDRGIVVKALEDRLRAASTTTETPPDFRCDPWCDPEHPDAGEEEALQGVYDYGFSLFSSAYAVSASCDRSAGTGAWGCAVLFQIPGEGLNCGRYIAVCYGTGQHNCTWNLMMNCTSG